jgi:hypothetical protein
MFATPGHELGKLASMSAGGPSLFGKKPNFFKNARPVWRFFVLVDIGEHFRASDI